MSETLFVRRRGATLVPCSNADEEALLAFPEGKDLTAEIRRPRSTKQHRFFMGLLRLVCENSDFYNKPEQLLLWLKLRLGYVSEVKFHDGQAHWTVASISFNSMKQDEFRKFFDESVDLIVTEVLPGMHKATLIAEVESMLGMKLNTILKEADHGV
jgi:hypothetical protein